MKWKICRCEACKKVVAVLEDSKAPTVCCGQDMKELPLATEGAKEKHIPVVQADGNRVSVKVSTVDHPMLPEHHIEWIAISTKYGGQIKKLGLDEKAEAEFTLAEGDEFISALELCNLHGLWEGKAE